MKRAFIVITFIFFSTLFCVGQDIAPAPADKAVIYFVRTSSLGLAINFSYFDSSRLIGKFNGPKYIRYECDPGFHLLWARSENKDFVEADVEAGKIYFIEAVPQMGGIKAGVKLDPIDPTNEKKMNRLMKLLNKRSSESFTAEELEEDMKKMKEVIERGLEKYKEEKEKGKTNERLEKTMYYNKQ